MAEGRLEHDDLESIREFFGSLPTEVHVAVEMLATTAVLRRNTSEVQFQIFQPSSGRIQREFPTAALTPSRGGR